MRISRKLSVTFSVAAIFLLAAGVTVIFVIEHLNKTLNDISVYNLQADQAAATIGSIRISPDATTDHRVRLNDLEKWARTDRERSLIAEARDQLTRAHSPANAIGKLEELAAFYHDATEIAHNHLLLVHHRAVLGVIVIMFDSVLLLVVLMYLVRRWLLNPVLDACDNASRIADGNLNAQPSPSREPELAALSDAINRMAAKLRELDDRLGKSEKLAVLGESCAHISQTMRGMLASIRSLAQYESSAGKISSETRAAFTYIIATINKLDAWIRSTISMVKPVDLHPAKQQLEPIIRDSLSLLEPQMADKQLDVKLESADDLPNVLIDRGLIEQALVSILTNAIEASPPQGRIAVRTLGGENGHVAVRIEDQGEGMTQETKTHAFDTFFTTKEQGAGLGLTVARNIIMRHGGTIKIESEPDKGTAVVISLPVVR